ncbi:hypothetical protein DFQ27_001238 [Actinomortierella ambigua]|uniref:Uncharacterized protein n=1 Tax=Actinomortierella ambigua TaxID=1343610 RepID=A0A9P6UCT7_9FUNG|nr:hypothetical protein DFQ27_001238 [Actinomortierella ambigua]
MTEKAYPQNATAPDGEVFQFYNGTDTAGTLMLQEAFVNIAKASSTNYSDMSLSSPRSIESCLTRSLGEHRCTRHSLGYLLSRKGHLFVITRRVFTMTHSMQLSQTFNQREIPEFVDPSVNTTIDCRRFPTPTLETLCMRLNFLGVPSFYMLYATQLLTDDKHGRSHWDGVNTQLSTVPVDSTGNRAFVMTVEAIHVDVGVEYYNTTVNRAELNRASKTDELRMQGHEAFEATYYVDNEHLDTYDHSWVDWGYSEDDIHNLTAFLTQGTMLNLGLIILQAPEFLAHVSNLAVILLFSASILMGGAGLLLSFAHDPVPAPETPESGSPELTKQKVSELEKA